MFKKTFILLFMFTMLFSLSSCKKMEKLNYTTPYYDELSRNVNLEEETVNDRVLHEDNYFIKQKHHDYFYDYILDEIDARSREVINVNSYQVNTSREIKVTGRYAMSLKTNLGLDAYKYLLDNLKFVSEVIVDSLDMGLKLQESYPQIKSVAVKESKILKDNKLEAYYLDSKDGKILIRYYGDKKSLNITKDYVEIAPYAFSSSKNLVEVTLPETLKKIDDYAFSETLNLSKVIIPNCEVKISPLAFSLKNDKLVLVINDSDSKIEGVTTLKSSDSYDFKITDDMVIYNDTLISVLNYPHVLKINEGIKKIGKDAINDELGSLYKLILPESLESLNADFLLKADHLAEVCNLSKVQLNLAFKVKETHQDKSQLVIKNHLVMLDNMLVKYEKMVNEEAIIPSNVLEVNRNAFKDNTVLKKVRFKNKDTVLLEDAFRDSKVEMILLPENLEVINKGVFKNSLIKVIDLSNVKVIKEEAFYNTTKLLDVKFSNNLETIESKAFYNNLSLLKLAFNKNLKNISNDSFQGCINVLKVTINKNLKDLNFLNDLISLKEVVNLNKKFSNEDFYKLGIKDLTIFNKEKTNLKTDALGYYEVKDGKNILVKVFTKDMVLIENYDVIRNNALFYNSKCYRYYFKIKNKGSVSFEKDAFNKLHDTTIAIEGYPGLSEDLFNNKDFLFSNALSVIYNENNEDFFYADKHKNYFYTSLGDYLINQNGNKLNLNQTLYLKTYIKETKDYELSLNFGKEGLNNFEVYVYENDKLLKVMNKENLVDTYYLKTKLSLKENSVLTFKIVNLNEDFNYSLSLKLK